MAQLRRSYHRGDFEAVARIVMAMGGSKHADEMHCALAQESLVGSVYKFVRMLRTLRKNDLPPHHAVELWRMVEAWFRQRVPNAVGWAAVVDALVTAGHFEEAFDIIRAMERGEDERLPVPTYVTYTIMVLGLAEQQGTVAAASLLSRMALRAVEPDSVTYLLLIMASARSGDLDMAKRFLRKAEERMIQEGGWHDDPAKNQNAIFLYNTVMAGYMKLGRMKEGFSLLGCLRRRGIRPSAYTFHIIMHACMQYSSYGTQECRQLLRVMQQVNVEPTTANYNVLIRGYGTSGQLTSALRVANRMREAGISWDRYTYFYLISAVVTAGQVELSLRLLAKMRRDGVRPTAMHYTVAFVGLARAGFYEDACRVFRRLVSIKDLATPYAYNMMISIHCLRGDMTTALEVQTDMEDKSFESNVMTFRVLLEGYSMQQQWDAALALQAPLTELRGKLVDITLSPVATDAAREQAVAALEEPVEVRNWTKAYHLLIDAAVWNGEWPRAVRLVEEIVEHGLPVDPWKHSRLLQDAKESVRFSQGVGRPVQQPESKAAQAKWVEQLPSMLQGAATGTVAAGTRDGPGTSPTSCVRPRGSLTVQRPPSQARSASAEADEPPGPSVPAHLLCASFSPEWLEGARPERTDSSAVFGQCLRGEPISSEDAYRVVHDYYHATVHRRSLVSLRLPKGHVIIGRVAQETPESLQRLFDSFGQPGACSGTTYIFTRPAACSLDVLLGLLSAAAADPEEVLLLRSQNDEGRISELVEECRARGDRPLSYCLASTLMGLPMAAMLNSRVLIADAVGLDSAEPKDFEDNMQAVLPATGSPAVEQQAGGQGSSAAAWTSWLRRQRLQHLVRCEEGVVRLDGATQRPALSKAELFRARVLEDRQVAVDLWLDEERGVSTFVGT